MVARYWSRFRSGTHGSKQGKQSGCMGPSARGFIVPYGVETPEELISDLGALSVQLDPDVLKRLDGIWPGPGEAPQAYAW